MKHKSWHLNRRELLKGGGVALALPLLGGMGKTTLTREAALWLTET